MRIHRDNPESDENTNMTLDNQRAVFAAKMQALANETNDDDSEIKPS